MTREEAVAIANKFVDAMAASHNYDTRWLVNSLEAFGLLKFDLPAFKPTPAEDRARDVFSSWSLPGNDIIRDLRNAGLEIVERKSDG